MERISGFTIPFLLAAVAITLVLATKDLHLSNMKPILSSGFGPIAKGTLLLLTLPFGESILCAPLFRR